MRYELDRALAAQGLEAPVAVEVPTAWLVCAMVRAGTGLAVVDPLTAVAQYQSGLVVRPLKEKIILRYGIMILRERLPTHEANALARAIEEEMISSLKAPRFRH